MGKLDGKVAVITGAARGQGRSHALRLAEEGANIIALDRCADVPSVPYSLSTPEDLKETVRAVEEHDRRIVAVEVDVRDGPAMKQAVAEGVAQLGRLDIVIANAGVASFAPVSDMPEDVWQDMIDINLTGVFKAVQAALPHLSDGGAIVLTGSTASIKAGATMAHYTAAKHGVIGLMRTLALELGARRIRVNAVLPTTVDTAMVHNPALYNVFYPDAESTDRDDMAGVLKTLHALPIPWVEPVDISNACLFLASDDARFITGVALPVDAGWLIH